MNTENIMYQAEGFEISSLIRGMEVMKNGKFQLNVSKILPARPKKCRDMGFEYGTTILIKEVVGCAQT